MYDGTGTVRRRSRDSRSLDSSRARTASPALVLAVDMSASSLVNDTNGLSQQEKSALEKAKEQLSKALAKDSRVQDRDLQDLLMKQVVALW